MGKNLLAGKQTRLNHLDFYKGMCILFILVTHFDWTDQQRLKALFPFWIDMAVPVFMVITGYVSALSFQVRGQSLRSAYCLPEIIRKCLRFIIPFLPVYVMQVVLRQVVLRESMSALDLLMFFITGGKGPGSYYFPVMLQIVIIVPLICAVVKKLHLIGLMGCFGVDILFEIVKTVIDMDPAVYRLCAFRYIFVVAIGVFLYFRSSDKNNIWSCAVGGAGVAYIIVFNYTAAEPWITNQWTTTSVFAVLYLIPIMIYLMGQKQIHCSVIELLGKASYNIYLTQLGWYWAAARRVHDAAGIGILSLAIDIAACSLLGVIFYKIENPITRRLTGKLKTGTKSLQNAK